MRVVGVLLLPLLALLPAGCMPAGGARVPVILANSEVRVVATKAGDREYSVLVSVPPGPPPANGWPVIYTLDGAGTFATMAAANTQQAGRTGMTGVVPAVVVGIAYPTANGWDNGRRQADLTPPGAEEFHAFLETILKPEIERTLPIDRRRQALFGHSLSGLFVLHALFNHPGGFQRYVAASPSIWWNGGAILRDAERFVALPPEMRGDARLLLTVGEYEQTVEPTRSDIEGTEKQRQRRMVDNARDLSQRLQQAGLDAGFVVFPQENHGSVIPAAISRAVRFAASGG